MAPAVSIPELEVDDEDDDVDDLRPVAITFFAGAEHDLAVCTNVWRMYLRGSVDHGVTAPPARSATPPPPPSPPEQDMSDLSERVSECHASLTKAHGRAPTTAELFDAVGAKVGRNKANVHQCAKRLELELTSMRGRRAEVPRKSAKGGGNRPKKKDGLNGNGRHAEAEHPEVSSTGVAASLTIMALQTERSRVVAELSAIDRVIERFARGA